MSPAFLLAVAVPSHKKGFSLKSTPLRHLNHNENEQSLRIPQTRHYLHYLTLALTLRGKYRLHPTWQMQKLRTRDRMGSAQGHPANGGQRPACHHSPILTMAHILSSKQDHRINCYLSIPALITSLGARMLPQFKVRTVSKKEGRGSCEERTCVPAYVFFHMITVAKLAKLLKAESYFHSMS